MDSNLTIALPTSTFLPGLGGIEVGLHNIALRLQQRGHRPIVIVPTPHYKALQNGWSLPYKVIPFPAKIFGLLRRYPPLGFAILDAWFELTYRRYRFDFWHCTMGYPTGVSLVHYARRRRAVPHLVRCAGEDIQCEPTLNYGLRLDPRVDAVVRRWLPQADMLVAITASVADEYRAIGVPEERIAFVPNGVDVARLQQPTNRALTRKTHGIGDSEKLILAVGRNHPKKGFATLLSAAAALKANGRDNFRILIVGMGADALQAQARALGIEAKTLLLDQIGGTAGRKGPLFLPDNSLIALYQAADVFVLPSVTETFGVVLVEAMAAGLPVITTDAPGCRDIIREGRDGLMIPANDAYALAGALERVLGEPGLAADLSARSRARAQDFAWDDVVTQYEALYRKIISQHNNV